MMQKKQKMIETLAHGYSSGSTVRELSNEYQHDWVLKGFEKSLRPCALMKVASALEGLIYAVRCYFGHLIAFHCGHGEPQYSHVDKIIPVYVSIVMVRVLSQDLETGCHKLTIVKCLSVLFFKGDYNALRLQPQTCIYLLK